MPRILFEEPVSPRHRPRSERDRTVFVVKFATLVVVTGLAGGLFLLSGGDQPATPAHTAAGRSTPSSSVQAPPATTPPVVVAPPLMTTATSKVVAAPPPRRPALPSTRSTPPVSRSRNAPTPTAPGLPRWLFAVPGAACPWDGGYALTAEYQPVICQAGAWRLVR